MGRARLTCASARGRYRDGSHLIVTEDKVRVVHDWPDYQYPLNSALVNPPSQYGDIDDCLQLLSPEAFLGGAALQDCSLHWLASPSCR